MFVSPCTFRSTQCAALIALAAVAGVTRIETTDCMGSGACSSPAANLPLAGTVRSLTSLFFAVPTATPAWLQTFTSFALWFVRSPERAPATPEVTASILPGADKRASEPAPPVALPPDRPLALSELDLLSATSVAPSSGPLLAARCTQPYLIPFAVGPPSRRENFTLCATGTSVPSDVTATGLLHSTDTRFPPSRSIQPRIACVKFSGPALAGLVLSPSSALRGEPAHFLCRPLVALPSFGVSVRRGVSFCPSLLST